LPEGFPCNPEESRNEYFQQSPLEGILPERKSRARNDFVFFMFITTGS